MSADSKSLNALRHGAYAATQPITKTNRRFRKAHRQLKKRFRPHGPVQRDLVRDFARYLFRMREFRRYYARTMRAVLHDIDAVGHLQSSMRDHEIFCNQIA